MPRPLLRVLVVVFVMLVGAMTAMDWSAAGQNSPAQETEATLKMKVAEATRRLAREGIIASSGHVSARIPGTDRILIGPGYVTRDILSPDDIVTVDLNTKQIAGKHERPGETDIHTGIYRARPDVMAVVHSHPVHSVTFSVTKKPILPVSVHGAIFADGVPTLDYVGHVNTRELGDQLARVLGHRRAALLKMHGAVIVGASVEEAFVAAIQLEENAEKQLWAEMTGTVHTMTPEEVAQSNKDSFRRISIEKRWQYYEDKERMATESQ